MEENTARLEFLQKMECDMLARYPACTFRDSCLKNLFAKIAQMGSFSVFLLDFDLLGADSSIFTQLRTIVVLGQRASFVDKTAMGASLQVSRIYQMLWGEDVVKEYNRINVGYERSLGSGDSLLRLGPGGTREQRVRHRRIEVK